MTIALAGLLTLVLGACGTKDGGSSSPSGNSPQASAAGFPLTVQSCDREVTIKQPPKRVVTQGPEAPVLVAAAGAADRVVARNGEASAPLGQYAQALQHAPVIGKPGDMLSKEETIAQHPDLVINRGAGNDLTADALAEVGIPAVVVTGRCTTNTTGVKADGSFEQIYAELEKFGRIFGTEAQAVNAVVDLRRRVAAAREQATRAPAGTTAAAVYIGGDTVYTYGNLATINAQMTTLGMKNVYGDQAKRYIESSLEDLIARKPDVLIVLTDQEALTTQQVISKPQLANLSAVRDGRVLSLPFGLSAASPLAVDGLEQLAQQLAK